MAMSSDLSAIVAFIERERGVDREIVLRAIESAIQKAAKKNVDVTNDLRVVVDRKTLQLRVFDTMVVSDDETGTGFISLRKARRFQPDIKLGETIELEFPASKLGRITAVNTRQEIMQQIRQAEHDNTLSEYRNRIGDIVSGVVTHKGRREIMVQVGRTEMVLPAKDCIPGEMETLQVGDTIRAVIRRVEDHSRSEMGGPSVTLSRSSNEFVRKLFALEVSEIGEGVVEIMGVARDPGHRAKISVRTNDKDVDPVGACVGLKGARVRNIVRELCGEKIDVVRYNDDIRAYVVQALSPAKLESVEFDPDTSKNIIHVTVAPDQYQQAIGRRGQNVRLTNKLIGWKVDVQKAASMTSFEDQRDAIIHNLADIFGISSALATQIATSGFTTIEDIVSASEDYFIQASGLDEITGKGLYAAALEVAKMMGIEPTGDDDVEYEAEPAAEGEGEVEG